MTLYALHRLGRDTLDAAVEAAVLEGAQVRADHPSNPGWRDCLELTGTAQDLVAFVLAVEALLRDQEDAQPLVDALTSVRTHPAGHHPDDGFVYFWPTITVTEEGARP